MADMGTYWLLAIAEQYGNAPTLRVKRQIAALKSWRKRKRRGETKLHDHCYTAQLRWINKSQRKTDGQLPVIASISKRPRGRPRLAKEKIKGRGKWKQIIPEQVRRYVFTKGTISFRTRAGGVSHHSSISNLACGCSLNLLKLEWEAIRSLLETCYFGVFQFICDTASYRFLYGANRGKATDTHLLGLHGRLLCGNESLDSSSCQEDEVIAKPVALEANSAACQWSGFEATMPPPLFDLLKGILPPGVRMFAICMGADEHSVNKMVLARLQEIASTNDRLLVVPEGWCRQHGTGNILEPVIHKLGLYSPSFCCAKRMRSDTFYKSFLASVKAEIQRSMVWIRKSEQPDFHPDEDNMKYSTAIMKLAHHRKRLAFKPDGDAAALDLEVESAECTERAARFVRSFPGNWRTGEIIYHEYTDESETFADAVDRAYSHILDIGFHVLGDPAQNKWFTVWQLFNSLVLMMAFHKVFVRAWRQASRVDAGEDDEVSDFTESEKLGIDSAENWHRRERRRDLKVLQWIERKFSFFKGMLFLYVSGKVTALHFHFFKDAHVAPYGDDASVVFDLCDDARSRPVAILQELLALLSPAADWGVLTLKFGSFATWPSHWKRVAHEVVFALAGGVKHRLVDPYKKAPFTTWVRFADPKCSNFEKQVAANHLFDCDEKALDESSLKLRKVCGSAAQLVADPFWSKFLFHAANKISLSSAFVECIFASFKQWLRCCPKPIQVTNLQSRYIPVAFSSANEKKRERMGYATQTTTNLRPEWILKRGEHNRVGAWQKHVGEHLVAQKAKGNTFAETLGQAKESYRKVSPNAKAQTKAQAAWVKARSDYNKIEELQQVGATCTDLPSIWDTSRCDFYPLHRDDIQQQLLDIPYGVIRAAEEWKGGGNTPLAGHPDFPSEVKYLRPLSIVETQAGVDKDFADDILASLRVLFAPLAVRADIYKPLLITDGSGHKCIMQVLFISRAPTFAGQCMFYALPDNELWSVVPIELPSAFTISAADSDSILRLSDWAA